MGGSAALPMVLVKSVDLKIMLLLVCNPDHQSSVYRIQFSHVAIKLHECMNGFLHRLSLHQFMVHNAKGIFLRCKSHVSESLLPLTHQSVNEGLEVYANPGDLVILSFIHMDNLGLPVVAG